MKKEMIFIFFIFTIFFISFISASFTIGNLSHSITKDYLPARNITGWVNISLSNQPSNSILESSLEGSINLIDLINKNSNTGFDYTCSPLSCDSDYILSNKASSKTFDLGEEDSVLFGFNISSTGGNLVSDISGFSFDLISNNPETEKFPLAIDILNNGEKEWQAYNSSGNFGGEYFGCYVGISGSTTKAKIIQTPYCEKISLSQTPEVEIGAYVNYVQGTKTVPFTISIKRTDSLDTVNCQATATGNTPNERISCKPSNFHINEDGNYFVCIKTTNSADINKYEIAYEQNNPCGFSGSYSGTYNYDFEIFARQAQYSSSISFKLNDTELKNSGSSINLKSYIKNYISDRYNNNCSKGCIIPVKIYSGVPQQIIVSNALIQYVAGISTETRSFYDVQETSAKISSGFQKLYLDEAGFKVPSEYDDYTFSLSLGNEELFSEKINVMAQTLNILSLNPTTTAVEYPTKFKTEVSSVNSITKYIWDFGDGSVTSTTIGEASHTYSNVGKYLLKITVSDSSGGNFSKEFNIDVAPASQIVPILLENAEIDIANIKSQMASFSQFEQKSLNDVLNLDEVESNITQLKDDASQASSEGDWEAILGNLLEIKIPQFVAKTVDSEGITFYPEAENLDLDILKKISGSNYETDKENAYREAILAWDVENIDAILKYSEISMIYDNYEDASIKVFDFEITNKGSDSSYFIIKNMENLIFEKDYSEQEDDGYVYIELTGTKTDVAFSTTEDVDFISLPAFISPKIDSLVLVGGWSPFEETGELKKWIFFTIIVTLVLFSALIVWGILQLWYKRKYENYLFKNRNNLYNLMNFIESEKKKGVDENDIRKKLKKAGWNSEQLRYALRKYEGKTTGLPEIISIGDILAEAKEMKEKKNSDDKT